MEQKEYGLCLREYGDCKCELCKAKASYEVTEQKLSIINVERNSLGSQYSLHMQKIHEEVGLGYGRIKVDSNYDEKSKRLWLKMKDLDKKANRLIYKLNSLERKMDLYAEEPIFS